MNRYYSIVYNMYYHLRAMSFEAQALEMSVSESSSTKKGSSHFDRDARARTYSCELFLGKTKMGVRKSMLLHLAERGDREKVTCHNVNNP